MDVCLHPKLAPEAFFIGGEDDEALCIEDLSLPEPPEAPPAVDNAVSFSMDLEDSFLPEPPEAPPELQGADYHEVCATAFELGGMVPSSLCEAAIGSAVDGAIALEVGENEVDMTCVAGDVKPPDDPFEFFAYAEAGWIRRSFAWPSATLP